MRADTPPEGHGGLAPRAGAKPLPRDGTAKKPARKEAQPEEAKRAGPTRRIRIDPKGGIRIDPKGGIRIDPKGGIRIDPKGGIRIDPKGRTRIDPKGRTRIDPKGRTRIDPKGRVRGDQKGQTRRQPKGRIRIDQKGRIRIDQKGRIRIDQKGRIRDVPRHGLAAAVLALAVAAAWLPSLSIIAGQPARLWSGYVTLLIRSDVARSGALQKVVDALGQTVVSELTAPVRFWNFTGEGSVPVGQLEARIDHSDPRNDRVMEDLPAYFRSADGRWSIAYVPSSRSAAADYLKIASVLGIGRWGAWKLAEFDPLEWLISAAALAGLAAFFAYPFQKGRLRLAIAGIGALLWIPFLVPGGAARPALAFLLFATWFPAVDFVIARHGWDDKLLREARVPFSKLLAAAGACLALFLPACGFSRAAVAAFAGPVAGTLLLLVALAVFWGRARRPRRLRGKFEPIPILETAPGPPTGGRAAFLLVLAVLPILAAIHILRGVSVPTPQRVFGVRDFSWESLSRLGREHHAPRLPDITDLVTHEAFQQSIAFGRPWGLPARDERVRVREYSMNERTATIVAGFRTVKVFDDAWLDSVIRRPAHGSVEGMLVSQDRAVAVAARGQVGPLVRELPAAVLVLFVFAAWFRWERATAPLMRGALLRLNDSARRSQTP